MEINKQLFTSNLTKIFSSNSLSSLLSMEIMEKFYLLTVRMLEENEKYNSNGGQANWEATHWALCGELKRKSKDAK